MHTSHKTYLFGGPLEAGNDGILDFVQVLNSLSTIDQDVGSKGVGTEAPDLTGFSDVVFVFIGQVTTSDLEILLVGNFTLKGQKYHEHKSCMPNILMAKYSFSNCLLSDIQSRHRNKNHFSGGNREWLVKGFHHKIKANE